MSSIRDTVKELLKWEYLNVTAEALWVSRVNGIALKNSKETSKYLNELGEQGWELVAFYNQTIQGQGSVTLFFKRPKS